VGGTVRFSKTAERHHVTKSSISSTSFEVKREPEEGGKDSPLKTGREETICLKLTRGAAVKSKMSGGGLKRNLGGETPNSKLA